MALIYFDFLMGILCSFLVVSAVVLLGRILLLFFARNSISFSFQFLLNFSSSQTTFISTFAKQSLHMLIFHHHMVMYHICQVSYCFFWPSQTVEQNLPPRTIL